MEAKRKVSTTDFFALHPVFNLEEATRVLGAPGGRIGTVERLKYHLGTGALKSVARGIYAVVPRGQSPDRFQPDAFLVARAVRPEGVFCHHSALELLGVGHSEWRQCTVYSERRRPPLQMTRDTVLFLEHPAPLVRHEAVFFGTRKVEWRGAVLRTTGPERTLVEGFHRMDLAGGFEEFVASASGFPTLDLDLLSEVLDQYGMATLWASAGWFLEACRHMYGVPEAFLQRLEAHRPKSPQYLRRNERGGKLSKRWNIILPAGLPQLEKLDAG